MKKWFTALTVAGIGGLWLGAEIRRRHQQVDVVKELELLCSLIQIKQYTCVIVDQLHMGISAELLAELDNTLASLASILLRLGNSTGKLDVAALKQIASTRQNISAITSEMQQYPS